MERTPAHQAIWGDRKADIKNLVFDPVIKACVLRHREPETIALCICRA